MPPPLAAAAELGVSYRPATDADMPFLAALYASTRREELALTGWPAAKQDEFLTLQHTAQHRHYRTHFPDAEWLVVEHAGQAIGRLYLDDRRKALHIVDISLMPGSRGRGIGSAILRDVFAQARSCGKDVTIHVEKFNPARSLYERLGFTVIEDRGVYDLMRAALQ